jgi:hypothetical protein
MANTCIRLFFEMQFACVVKDAVEFWDYGFEFVSECLLYGLISLAFVWPFVGKSLVLDQSLGRGVVQIVYSIHSFKRERSPVKA